MTVINPYALKLDEEVDPTDLGFTLYGPIPIFIPLDIIENYQNLISEYKTSDSIVTSVSTAGGHEIVIDGWIAGRFKKLFKEGLIQIRNVQAGLGEPVYQQIEAGQGVMKGNKYIGALPFATDMTFEVDMLIRSLEFGHHFETKDAYRVKLVLRQQRIVADWKQQLIKTAIRAGIIAIAPMVRALVNFLNELNFSSYVEITELNKDLDGGWSLALIPAIDPVPKSTDEIVEIPSGMEKKDYDVNPNLEIGFDTDLVWYRLPILEGSEFPQHWQLQSNSDIYEIILQIIPSKEEKYLKVRIEKEDEILFSQRVEEGMVYKIDRDSRRVESTDAEGEIVYVDADFYKLWLGFTKLELKMTQINPKGEASIINGAVRFESA